jgi:hypothetical protein
MLGVGRKASDLTLEKHIATKFQRRIHGMTCLRKPKPHIIVVLMEEEEELNDMFASCSGS